MEGSGRPGGCSDFRSRRIRRRPGRCLCFRRERGLRAGACRPIGCIDRSLRKLRRELPADAIAMLAERADANLVQVIGRNGLLFKRNFEKPKIELP